MLYLFLGQDILDANGASKKNQALAVIKKECLSQSTKDFNLDTLHAKGLTLKNLQETLLYLPARAKQRMLVLKNAQDLKTELKDFLLEYIKKPLPRIVLVLDYSRWDIKDNFVKALMRSSRVLRFKEEIRPDTFGLGRQIDLKRADNALRMLHQLLQNGEKPEWILGGLRYAYEQDSAASTLTKKRLQLLLACDMNIKTGKVRPEFALERLIIRLCMLKYV